MGLAHSTHWDTSRVESQSMANGGKTVNKSSGVIPWRFKSLEIPWKNPVESAVASPCGFSSLLVSSPSIAGSPLVTSWLPGNGEWAPFLGNDGVSRDSPPAHLRPSGFGLSPCLGSLGRSNVLNISILCWTDETRLMTMFQRAVKSRQMRTEGSWMHLDVFQPYHHVIRTELELHALKLN